MSLLRVENLHVHYGSIHAIKVISFEVNEGEIVTLIGACGFRVVWIYTIFATHHDLRVLYISYPISWILTALVHFICLMVVRKKLHAESAAMAA